jgi:simple sugar transport system ATP-binding protein
VLELCDEVVVVLRDGEVVGTRPVAGASRADLARMMVGREVAPGHEWTPREAGAELLLVVDLHGRDVAGVERLSGVSFSVRAGEVFAIAGVDGNGQAELAEAIGGLVAPAAGHVYVDGADLTAGGIGARLDAGMAHIPADRASTGLVGDMTIAENIGLRDFDRPPFRRGVWLDAMATRRVARDRVERFAIRAAGVDAPARTLSGGNQQKVVLAREIWPAEASPCQRLTRMWPSARSSVAPCFCRATPSLHASPRRRSSGCSRADGRPLDRASPERLFNRLPGVTT